MFKQSKLFIATGLLSAFFLALVALQLANLLYMFVGAPNSNIILSGLLVVLIVGLVLYINWSERNLRRLNQILSRRSKQPAKPRDPKQDALVNLARNKTLYSGNLDEALRQVTLVAGETLQVERVSVWFLSASGEELTCACNLERSGLIYSSGRTLQSAKYPCYFKTLYENRVIAADDVRTDSAVSEFLEDYIRPLGISAMLDAPIRVDGKIVGVICHEHVAREPRKWSMEEQTFAGSIADMIAIAMEVCGRKKAEGRIQEQDVERKLLEEKLLQSQKMEAIGQLAGGIAHDFNNILTGILGYAGLLKIIAQGEGEIVHAAEKIEKAALRAEQMTGQLLGFARKGKNQNIPVDMHEIIREVLTLLARAMEPNIVVYPKLRASNCHVLGDPVQMQQVLLNLAINARDAMTKEISQIDGGELCIETKVVKSSEGFGANGTVVDGGEVLEIAVSDTGCGIEDEIRNKIFEPFFTTKEAGHGTGMGLAMVYGIVKNHGGAIQVESKVGKGTTFRLQFPLVKKFSRIASDALQVDAPRGNGNVLVVDDHDIVRDVASRMLSSLGYQVRTAKDGVEAIQIFREDFNTFDLVLVDMIMPGMGARECFRRLKEIKPDIRVVLVTGYGLNNAVQELLDAGMLGFVSKPFQMHKLAEVVKKALS